MRIGKTQKEIQFFKKTFILYLLFFYLNKILSKYYRKGYVI